MKWNCRQQYTIASAFWTDIGRDGNIEVAANTYKISGLKRGLIYTPNDRLAINSENLDKPAVFDGDGMGFTRKHVSDNNRLYLTGLMNEPLFEGLAASKTDTRAEQETEKR